MIDKDDLIDGINLMLYIKVNAGMLPVCALTSNPFTRTTGRLETTARGGDGYRSYIPTLHDYELSFGGILSKNTGVVSWKDLDYLQENKNRIVETLANYGIAIAQIKATV